jgi:hypothetical protein
MGMPGRPFEISFGLLGVLGKMGVGAGLNIKLGNTGDGRHV